MRSHPRSMFPGGPEFLFPAPHTTLRPISDSSLNVALRRLGFEHDEVTSHGFPAGRASIRESCP